MGRSGSGSWIRIGILGCVLLAAAPRDAVAQLSASGTHGSTSATFGEGGGPAQVSLSSGPDGVTVGLEGSVTGLVDLLDTWWDADFEYAGLVFGAGLVEWGQASGEITVDVSAEPEIAYPLPANPNDPLANNGFAAADGLLLLQFVDTGTVTSGVLAPGTPVTLDVSFWIDTVAIQPAPHPDPFVQNSVGSSLQGTVSDQTSTASVYRLVNGSQIVTASLDTAVGRTLGINGQLTVRGEARAGRSTGFLLQALGEISTAGGLWLTPPAGVGFVSASGHDYTVPEPDTGALAAAAALAFAALGTAARSPRPPGA